MRLAASETDNISVDNGSSLFCFFVSGMVAGTAIAYAFGTIWFCFSTGTGVMAALTMCVFPFLIGDAAKIIIAAIVGPLIGTQIRKLDK